MKTGIARFCIVRKLHPRDTVIQCLHGSRLASMGLTVPDPHGYSDGKWLRDNVTHQRARRIPFDFDALCRRVVDLCSGADSILSYEKKEGGFNRVFVFKTKNKRVILAKLPFSNAGPARLTTESEVATNKFLKKHTAIPMPNIVGWNSDRSNEIGSEYILMDCAPGVSLQAKWSSMCRDQRIQCISNIYEKLRPLNHIRFPAYGSVYFTRNTQSSPLKSSVAIAEDDEFCVGPHVGNRYWGCNVGDRRYYHNVLPNIGPWLNLMTWSDGLIDAGVSRVPPQDDQILLRPRYFGTVDMHLQLLRIARLLLRIFSEDKRLGAEATPVLFHPDLHKRNIFVSENDPTVVTGIIDWQSTSVEPAFWFATTTPDFAEIRDPVEFLSDDERTSQADPEAVACSQAFDASLKFYLPILAKPRSLNEDFLRPFHYGHRSWEDGVIALRHDFLMVSQKWKELGFEEPCPIPALKAEVSLAHNKDYQLFLAAQKLRKQVSDYLDVSSEGWAPNEGWERTQLQHRELFDSILQCISNTDAAEDGELIKTEEDLKAIWPYDL